MDDVVAEVEASPCRLLTLTGGEPLAQPDAFPLVSRLADRGFEVLVETSGHVSIEALDTRAVAILDVKAPGSGEAGRMHADNLDLLRPQDEVKLVLADRADYEWARDLLRDPRLAGATVLLSPVHGRLDPGLLGRWIVDDGLPVRLQIQLHKLLWPGVERGV